MIYAFFSCLLASILLLLHRHKHTLFSHKLTHTQCVHGWHLDKILFIERYLMRVRLCVWVNKEKRFSLDFTCCSFPKWLCAHHLCSRKRERVYAKNKSQVNYFHSTEQERRWRREEKNIFCVQIRGGDFNAVVVLEQL
jgi:hypothetical protein